VKSLKEATKFAPTDYNLLVVSDRRRLWVYPGGAGEALLGKAEKAEGAGGNAGASRASRGALGKETASGYIPASFFLLRIEVSSLRFQVGKLFSG
jgi:hypothetical protein